MAAAIVATGPSLTQEDCVALEAARAALPDRLRLVAVNDAWRLLAAADLVYAADHDWWAAHHRAVAENSPGERWSCDARASALFALNHVPGVGDIVRALAGRAARELEPVLARKALSLDPRWVGYGGNSAFQAANLALHFGVTRLIFLGLDLGLAPDGRRHFFGEHPGHLARDSDYALFRRNFEACAPTLQALGVAAVNCSRRTALGCFPRRTLAEVLAELAGETGR